MNHYISDTTGHRSGIRIPNYLYLQTKQ